MLAGELDLGDMRVVVADMSAFFFELLGEHVTRGLAVVIDVRFVSNAEEENLGALDRLAVVIKRIGNAGNHIVRHGGIDLAREFNETGVLLVFAGLPGQVKGINRNAVSAEAGPG